MIQHTHIICLLCYIYIYIKKYAYETKPILSKGDALWYFLFYFFICIKYHHDSVYSFSYALMGHDLEFEKHFLPGLLSNFIMLLRKIKCYNEIMWISIWHDSRKYMSANKRTLSLTEANYDHYCYVIIFWRILTFKKWE